MTSENHTKEFDIVIYGATGFTGLLIAEYLNKTYDSTELKWAIAGRNEEKLLKVSETIGLHYSFPVIVASSTDYSSLISMCKSAKVVISAVGPYTLYGENLVKACVETGTDYVDLSGESNWIRQMMDKYNDLTVESGARIVCSCGFDSLPSDLGVLVLQTEAQNKFGANCQIVRGRVRAMEGNYSGGTVESFKASMNEVMQDEKLLSYLIDPFALTPGFQGPKQPSDQEIIYEEDLESWSAPFIMASINTKIVHRTNFLKNHAYGKDLIYSEMVLTGPGDIGEERAKAVVAANNSIADENAPKPGEGPSKEERENGFFDILYIGETANAQKLKVSVKGYKDPGYGSTSKMIAEAAVCLSQDITNTRGGFWTGAALMGLALKDRLHNKAGVTFELEA